MTSNGIQKPKDSCCLRFYRKVLKKKSNLIQDVSQITFVIQNCHKMRFLSSFHRFALLAKRYLCKEKKLLFSETESLWRQDKFLAFWHFTQQLISLLNKEFRLKKTFSNVEVKVKFVS
ncbi:CLUMA_CG008203, isoform A [Clunio marinus]|uniref:CLUMA_CG008203, isoform A n=1 Tax=Clunio marinus TaxID=568069 RepID=A0A1J1I2X7_9DIPT|nr:CLUMA_CG008203, isoform A [Clunio marinus]